MQPPVLARSHKDGTIRILTRYKEHPNGNTTVFDSVDATMHFAAIVDELPIAAEHRDAVLTALGVKRRERPKTAQGIDKLALDVALRSKTMPKELPCPACKEPVKVADFDAHIKDRHSDLIGGPASTTT